MNFKEVKLKFAKPLTKVPYGFGKEINKSYIERLASLIFLDFKNSLSVLDIFQIPKKYRISEWAKFQVWKFLHLQKALPSKGRGLAAWEAWLFFPRANFKVKFL